MVGRGRSRNEESCGLAKKAEPKEEVVRMKPMANLVMGILRAMPNGAMHII